MVLTPEYTWELHGEFDHWAPTPECVTLQVWVGPEDWQFSQIPRCCWCHYCSKDPHSENDQIKSQLFWLLSLVSFLYTLSYKWLQPFKIHLSLKYKMQNFIWTIQTFTIEYLPPYLNVLTKTENIFILQVEQSLIMVLKTKEKLWFDKKTWTVEHIVAFI